MSCVCVCLYFVTSSVGCLWLVVLESVVLVAHINVADLLVFAIKARSPLYNRGKNRLGDTTVRSGGSLTSADFVYIA